MDSLESIDQLRRQLAEAEERYKQLCQQENVSPQALLALKREIADYKAILADIDSSSNIQREHTMKIDAPTEMAVAGDVHAPINLQSGGTRYESGSQHFGDNVQGDKYVYLTTEQRIEIDSEAAKHYLAEMPTDQLLERDIENIPAWSRIPSLPQSHFVGRERDLLKLAEQLKQGGLSVVTTGMGGIGKSTLASEFAYRYGKYFLGGVFWISFANRQNIDSEIVDCGYTLQLFQEREKLNQQEQIRRVYLELRKPIPRLLIFDNWDGFNTQETEQLLEKYVPKVGACRVLITSRNSQWASDLPIHPPLALGLLERAESIQLLQSFRPDLSQTEANEIAEELGDLPLALGLAGRYLERYRNEAFGKVASYLENLRTKRLEHPSLNKVERSLQATFDTSFQRLDSADPIDSMALALLARASYFAPNETIQTELLKRTVGEYDQEDEDQALLRADALNRLLELGFLEQIEQAGVRIHRLISTYVKQAMHSSEAQAEVETVLADETHTLVNQGIPSKLLSILPHLRYLYQLHKNEQDLDLAELALALGRAEQGQINYKAAEPLYIRALEISEQELGARHPLTAGSLNSLAILYYSQGRYGEAEPLYIRALEISEQELGARHPLTAGSLNNLAILYASQGRYGEAEPLYLRALEISEQELGARHPDTASSLNNLANLYESQGRYGEAEPLYLRALEISEQELGARHPLTAGSLNNLALLYRSQGRYGEAEPLYLRALEIREQELGARHPDTALSLNDLALLYYFQGRYGEAEPLYLRALEIREQELGARHPLTALSLNDLANLYYSQGRYGEAEPLYLRALEIREQELGARHPDTASSLNDLALLYSSQGRYGEAEPLYLRALEIREQILGPEHPTTVIVRDNLSQLQQLSQQQSKPSS